MALHASQVPLVRLKLLICLVLTSHFCWTGNVRGALCTEACQVDAHVIKNVDGQTDMPVTFREPVAESKNVRMESFQECDAVGVSNADEHLSKTEPFRFVQKSMNRTSAMMVEYSSGAEETGSYYL